MYPRAVEETSTATAMNKELNERNNGCARAL